jgi:hypothetical protein
MVSGFHPGDLGEAAAPVADLLQRPAQVLVFEPQPHLACRPGDGELGEHGLDDADYLLVGVPQDLPVGLAPDQPDGQAAAQLAAGGLGADRAGQPGPQHVELTFGHNALHPQDQPVVEQTGMIEAVGVGDQRVAGPGQVQQPVPGRILFRVRIYAA